jgi:NAD(P)-dependent dehydrogenase (short-subunit alcohol dehydrogenase family)
MDHVAVVTGGSGLPAREIARWLARRECAVAVVYVSHRDVAEATVDEIVAAGGAAFTVRADLRDMLDVERIFDEAIGGFVASTWSCTRTAQSPGS